MSSFKRYRDVGIVILLLAVPFFFLRANMKKPENLNAMDRAVLRVSAPIEFGASSLARGVSNVWDSYVYLVDVKADNERLAYENARLRESDPARGRSQHPARIPSSTRGAGPRCSAWPGQGRRTRRRGRRPVARG